MSALARPNKKYIAAILGGSGSVGKNVLKSLLADKECDRVILISRRTLDDLKSLDPSRVTVQICNPLDDIYSPSGNDDDDNNDNNSNILSGTNIAFCTIGHGSSRNASKDGLLRVDATIPGKFAKACKEAGVTHYCLMTAVGADENSKWNFLTRTTAGGGWYNHVKGLAERLTIDADIPYTYIAQPCTLLENPHTPRLLKYVPNSILPMNYTSASVSDIAKGMVATTIDAYQNNKTGIVTITGGNPITLSLSEALCEENDSE